MLRQLPHGAQGATAVARTAICGNQVCEAGELPTGTNSSDANGAVASSVSSVREVGCTYGYGQSVTDSDTQQLIKACLYAAVVRARTNVVRCDWIPHHDVMSATIGTLYVLPLGVTFSEMFRCRKQHRSSRQIHAKASLPAGSARSGSVMCGDVDPTICPASRLSARLPVATGAVSGGRQRTAVLRPGPLPVHAGGPLVVDTSPMPTRQKTHHVCDLLISDHAMLLLTRNDLRDVTGMSSFRQCRDTHGALGAEGSLEARDTCFSRSANVTSRHMCMHCSPHARCTFRRTPCQLMRRPSVMQGSCECFAAFGGRDCSQCAEGYVQSGGSCSRYVRVRLPYIALQDRAASVNVR